MLSIIFEVMTDGRTPHWVGSVEWEMGKIKTFAIRRRQRWAGSPFPFPNLPFHRRESKRECEYCERYQTSILSTSSTFFYNNFYWGGKMSQEFDNSWTPKSHSRSPLGVGPPLPLMALFSRHLFSLFLSFVIETYNYEMYFTLGPKCKIIDFKSS